MRKKLSLILIVCSVTAVFLSALFVNLNMNATFARYMKNVQNERNERIVDYFEQVYKNDGKWSKNSGIEMMHEAYMGNYCLTLLDKNKNVIWGMNPNDIREGANLHVIMGPEAGRGVYTSRTFAIKANGGIVGYAEVGQYYPVLLSEQDVNFKNSINKGIAVSILLTVIIVVLLSLTISKQFSYPIKKVSDISVELSKGNYESCLDVKSNIKEINNLIDSINQLSEKLKSQDMLRKRLVSDISHEIRTPLNILENNLEAMVDGIIPVTKEKLDSLNEEIIRFGKLLNNLNSLNRFEDDDLPIKMGKIDLIKLVGGVCAGFGAIAKEKNISIKFHAQSGSIMINGDEDKLKQVFINILSNAVKFNKVNGNVWADVYEEHDKAIVKIKDNGTGIKKEDLPFIFERLYRGDRSRNETAGSGIGLTVVKKLLSLHDASIDVQSNEGNGTVFTLYFNK